MSKLKIGIIGGSGLGDALGAEDGERHELSTPFGEPSSPAITTRWQGVDLVILQRHGVGHVHNPSSVPYRANIFALKALGCTHVLASGATGSLREHIAPRDLVIADQIIDKTTKRANTFYENAAVHVELAEPFCPVMRSWLMDTARRSAGDSTASVLDGVTIHESGTYVCMEGPAFSTKAESEMHRGWGGDLIGMTVMPEARLAREAELPYALIALPTDYDCWRPHPPEVGKQQLLEEIIGHMQSATAHAIALIKAALADTTLLEESRSPAADALALGVWSDKTKIPADEIDRLHVLWGRHFT